MKKTKSNSKDPTEPPTSDKDSTATGANALELLSNFLKDYKWLGVGIGTLTVLSHFLRIRYLPSLSVTDVGLLALAILLFAILGLLAIGAICILPGTALIGWSTQRLIPRPRGPANRRDTNTPGRKDAPRSKNSNSQKKIKPTGAGLALIMIYGGFAIAFLAYYGPYKWLPQSIRDTIWLIIFIASTLTVFASSVLFDIRSVRYKALKAKQKKTISIVLTTSLYLASIPFFWLIPKVIYTGQTTLTHNDIIFLFSIPAIHWFMYITRGLPSLLRLGAPLAILLYIVSVIGIPFYLIDESLRTYGVGLLENQTVLVTRRGCDIAKAASLAAKCEKASTHGTDLFALGPVTIQTRLGSHILIADPGWTTNGKLNRVPVPATDVASWLTRQEVNTAPTQ